MGKAAATDRPYLRSLSHSFTLEISIFSLRERSQETVVRHEIKSFHHTLYRRKKL